MRRRPVPEDIRSSYQSVVAFSRSLAASGFRTIHAPAALCSPCLCDLCVKPCLSLRVRTRAAALRVVQVTFSHRIGIYCLLDMGAVDQNILSGRDLCIHRQPRAHVKKDLAAEP